MDVSVYVDVVVCACCIAIEMLRELKVAPTEVEMVQCTMGHQSNYLQRQRGKD